MPKKKNKTDIARLPYSDVPDSELIGEDGRGAAVHISKLPFGKSSRTLTKREVIDRDKKCLRCGTTEELSVDHIVPTSKGGDRFSDDNRQTLCRTCNEWKGDLTIDYRNGIPVPDPINEKIDLAKRRQVKRSKVKKVYKHTVELNEDDL